MNTGACDCCTSNPFFESFGRSNPPFTREPYFESRFRELERRKCAIRIDGIDYSETETEVFCFEDPDQISTLKKTISKGGNYFDPSVAFNADCNFQQEYDPPISSWTPPCGFNSIRFQEEVGIGPEVTDEELQEDILTILEQVSYSEWSLSSSPSSLSAYGSYSYDGGSALGFAEEKQYRIVHLPSPSCYLKVWISVAIYEGNIYEGLGNKISESDEIYEWQPTSSPCLPDPTKSSIGDEQIIRSEIYTVGPSEPNVTTIANLKKFSFLPNYEPDDPIVVDPFTFERPTPDFNSNGIPRVDIT